MRSRTGRLAAGLAALAVAAAGCGSSTGETAGPRADQVAVVASTNVWGSVVRAVGGDAVYVTSIINDPGADPHGYEARPADAVAVTGAKLLVFNGGGYDDFFTGLAGQAGANARQIVTFDLSDKGPIGTANEHVWYDLPTVRKVADKIAEELGVLAPDHRDQFSANAKDFDTLLDRLLDRTAAIGRDKPDGKVAATEPVAAYLVETAGLTDATPTEFAEAVENETDPPAAAVAELTGLVERKAVGALINNAQAETPATRAAKESAGRVGIPVVDVTETLPQGATGYLDWMTKQVNALAAAMAKS
ncbi:MAG: metal ABC transporter solute-binding protein, Zn/Mn family [Labedaea sp.]